MHKHISWFPAVAMLAVAMLGLCATGSIAPAEARGGGGGGGGGFSGGHAGPTAFVRVPGRVASRRVVAPRFRVSNRAFVARNFAFRNNLRLRQQVPVQSFWPTGGWWWGDSWPAATPTVIVGDGPAVPSVVVVSTPTAGAPDAGTPVMPPDYGYVAGCHPIPNGYHCDVAANAPTAH